MAERLPFQLSEEQILDLLEILDNELLYDIPERLNPFVKKLKGGREYFANQRLEEAGKEIEESGVEVTDEALLRWLKEN
jgi:hypothetical protein